MKHRALPRLSLLAQALLLLGGAAQAQTQPAAAPQQLERIEITGSSIKRIDAETALPVQVLKREDIAKTGASTAAELMKAISANTAGLTDGQSISDNTGGQRGLNAANLRGIDLGNAILPAVVPTMQYVCDYHVDQVFKAAKKYNLKDAALDPWLEKAKAKCDTPAAAAG